MLRLVLAGVVLLGAALAGWAQPELAPLALRDEQDLARLTAVVTSRDVADSLRVDAAKRLALLNAPETVNALLAALDDPLPEVRRHAARGLGLIGDPTTATTVAQLLRDPDADVRAAAVAALGWLANPAVLPALEEMLTDTNADARLAAVTALSRMDDPQVQPLLRNVAEDDGKAGAAALLALAQRGDRAITPLCLARAAQPNFNDLTITAALAELGDPAATATLGKLAEHKNMEIRRLAFVGLARIGDTAALDTLCRVMEGQAKILRSTGPESDAWLPALQMLPVDEKVTRFLYWTNRNFSTLMALHSFTGRILGQEYEVPNKIRLQVEAGDTFRGAIIDWLNLRQPAAMAPVISDPSNFRLTTTLVAPRQWRDSERLDGLLGPAPPPIAFTAPTPERGCFYLTMDLADRLLQGESPNMKALCHSGNHLFGETARKHFREEDEIGDIDWYGMALGILADACAVPDLLKAMEKYKGGPTYGLFAGLAGCADGRHPETYKLLLDAMAAPKPEVRKGALAGLGCCRDARAAPFIAMRMKDDAVPEVREYCALALGLIGDTRGVSPLCDALNDPVEWARSAAAWALGEIGDPRAIGPLQQALEVDKTPRFQVRVALALARLGDKDAAQALVELLGNKDGMTRELAYRGLLDCHDPRLVGALLARLAEKPDAAVIRALGRQQNAQAAPMLLPVLRETDYSGSGNSRRLAAAWALGHIGADKAEAFPAAADALVRAAERDPAPAVRAQAALALARLKDPRAVVWLDWVMRHYVPERNAAIRALWQVDDPKATDMLAEALETDDDPLGRVLAARGLALRNDPRGAAGLKALVTTVTERVALQAAVKFAADLRDPALAPTFIRLATAGHEKATIFIAVEAANALGQCPAPEATATLIALLDSPSSRLREAAARGLNANPAPAAQAALQRCLHEETASRVRAAAGM